MPAIAYAPRIARYAPAGSMHMALLVLQRIDGLPPACDLHTAMPVDSEPLQALLRRQDHRRIAIRDLRAVVGLKRQSIDQIAVVSADRRRRFQRHLDLLHLRIRIVLRIGIFLHRDCRKAPPPKPTNVPCIAA